MSIWTDDQGRTHVGIMVAGKRIHRRLPEGTSKSEAKLIEAELRKATGRKQTHIPGDPPLNDVMGLYLKHADTLRSPDTAKFHAVRAGEWTKDYRASDAEFVVAKMVKDMRGQYATGTINKTIGTVKKALSLAFQERMIPEDYGARIKRIEENNQRHIYLSIGQVKKLGDAASEQVRAAIWIALLTGCRRGEILSLTPQSIDGDRLHIKAGNTKTLRERTIPIVPALRPWLAYLPIKINAEGLKTGFARAREKAKITANFHDLRHSCASLLINLGTPLEVIRDILGHTTVKTTERYAHLEVERQAEALEKLSALI